MNRQIIDFAGAHPLTLALIQDQLVRLTSYTKSEVYSPVNIREVEAWKQRIRAAHLVPSMAKIDSTLNDLAKNAIPVELIFDLFECMAPKINEWCHLNVGTDPAMGVIMATPFNPVLHDLAKKITAGEDLSPEEELTILVYGGGWSATNGWLYNELAEKGYDHEAKMVIDTLTDITIIEGVRVHVQHVTAGPAQFPIGTVIIDPLALNVGEWTHRITDAMINCCKATTSATIDVIIGLYRSDMPMETKADIVNLIENFIEDEFSDAETDRSLEYCDLNDPLGLLSDPDLYMFAGTETLLDDTILDDEWEIGDYYTVTNRPDNDHTLWEWDQEDDDDDEDEDEFYGDKGDDEEDDNE